jgi:hypothetical protein
LLLLLCSRKCFSHCWPRTNVPRTTPSKKAQSAHNQNTMYVVLILQFPSCTHTHILIPHCYFTHVFTQLKVYAILLGDFGLFKRENFESIFSIFLAVFFTFATTTILLNVLIAVASDSVSRALHRRRNISKGHF